MGRSYRAAPCRTLRYDGVPPLAGLMTPGVALGLLAVTNLVVALVGWRRYGGPLNPLTIFAIKEGLIFTVFSGVVAIFVDPFQQIRPDAAVHAAALASVFMAGVVAAFLGRATLARRAYGGLLAMLYLDSPLYARRFAGVRAVFLVLTAAVAMAALAVVGGGGMLWLTESRTAYQFFRSGAGPFFSAYEWALNFALLYVLWSVRPRLTGTSITVLFFAGLMYFSGSKSFVLLTLVIGVSYYHFFVRRIPAIALALVFPLLAVGALGLQLAQGTAQDLLGTVLYFRDYFAFSAIFLERFDEFQHTYGATALSDLWSFVPRGLYPSKPYVYGVIGILDVLSPGLAERGHTAGILPWTAAYLDLGTLGVFLSGFFAGLVRRVAFEHFLEHRSSFFAFSFMLHFSLIEIWLFLPVPLVFGLAILQATFLRLVLVKTSSVTPMRGWQSVALPDPS